MRARPTKSSHRLTSAGAVGEGEADIVVLDVTAHWTVDPAHFHSKSRNTPFAGRTLTGRPVLTLVGGALVHEVSAATP